MKKYLLLILLPLNLFSQVNIKGIVLDSTSNEYLPYTSIYIEGTNKGTIANSEGAFEFKYTASLDDEVTFSYVGFQTKRILLKDLKAMKKVYLSKSTNNIDEVEVGGYFPKYLAKLLLRKKLQLIKDRHKTIDAKSFAKIFSTKNDTIEVELFKAFYASTLNDYEIKKNVLKNAKIQVDNVYGESLSSLDIFYQFIRHINFLFLEDVGDSNIYTKQNNGGTSADFDNPLLYKSVKKIVKLFDLSARKLDAEVMEISFALKGDPSQKGSFVINTKTDRLYSLELNRFYNEKPPLHFMGDVFMIDSLSLNYSVKFNNKNKPNLFKLNFEYFYNDSLVTANKIKSEAELFVYSFNETFNLPQYNFTKEVYCNDYFLASLTPENDEIWKLEPQIIESQNQYDFSENKSTALEYIGEELIEKWTNSWTPNTSKVQKVKSLTEAFEIETMIFYDVYTLGGKKYIETQALIDYGKTYWSEKPDPKLIKDIFDLTQEYAELLKLKLSEEENISHYKQIYENNWNGFLLKKKMLIDSYLN